MPKLLILGLLLLSVYANDMSKCMEKINKIANFADDTTDVKPHLCCKELMLKDPS